MQGKVATGEDDDATCLSSTLGKGLAAQRVAVNDARVHDEHASATSDEESTSGYWRGARIGIHYVQDRICEHAAVLCDLLFEREGRVYVCGDGQAMAKDVHEALRTAVMRGLKVERAEADAELEKLSREGRYCREIWN